VIFSVLVPNWARPPFDDLGLCGLKRIGRWPRAIALAGIDDLLARVAGHVGRVEPRKRMRQFVFALMAGLPRTNCWSIAEHAGERCPRGVQRFLSQAVWDTEAVLDDVRAWVVEFLGDPDAVLVIDETGDVKKGSFTVGTQRQYTGTAGRIENSQVAVYLTYTSSKGHALIGRTLAGLGYVLAIAKNHRISTGIGTRKAIELVVRLRPHHWNRLSAGRGAKGERWYDWALIDTTDPAAGQDGHHWLLVRRNRKISEYAFYRAWSPTPVPLSTLVKVAGRRWSIEESFAASKELAALDEHQVRIWTSWQRWSALAILAHAFLSVMTATEPAPEPGSGLIRLTRNEIRRLLALAIQPVHDVAHALHWSTWRRTHQARADTSHRQRQLITEPN